MSNKTAAVSGAGSNIHYTGAHLRFLQAGYQTMTPAALTIAFNQRFALHKTEKAITKVLNNYGIRCNRKRGLTKEKRVSAHEVS